MTVLSTLRLRFLPWTLLGAGLILVVLYGLAYAAGDPLGTAQTSVDGGIGLVTTYGPVLGSMYLLYQLASRLVAKYARASWLAKGKRLAIATGVLGVAGAALQAQALGAPWNVIALAAIAAVFKLLTPTLSLAKDPSTPSNPMSPPSNSGLPSNPTTLSNPVLPSNPSSRSSLPASFLPVLFADPLTGARKVGAGFALSSGAMLTAPARLAAQRLSGHSSSDFDEKTMAAPR